MTPGPWYYVSGGVWTTPNGPDDGGACIATRASASPIFPTDKDENLRACAAVPAMIEALEAILFQVNQGKVLERDACIAAARAALAKTGQQGDPSEPGHPDNPRSEYSA